MKKVKEFEMAKVIFYEVYNFFVSFLDNMTRRRTRAVIGEEVFEPPKNFGIKEKGANTVRALSMSEHHVYTKIR